MCELATANVSRRRLLECLMWTLLVVVPAETIEAPLLLGRVTAAGLDVSAFSVRCMRS
jgi:hypothetical protein